MEIGLPTNVEHVAHVTFDRFNGFLGLPSEFEPDVPRKAPSASSTVFGVSTESMQLSYDSRGNCVPVILLLMQSHLYSLGGLQTEGIFRIAADNSEEEHIREQLNKGVIQDGTDVHCLAGLIKAWFRELPKGILDSLPTEKVMQCETEGDFVELVRLLPQTEASLLNWAIHLMADVVHNEHSNKMNSRNIALVFAPNMSKMAEPLTALMYAIQVMNFLKTLVEKALRERERASFRKEEAVEVEDEDDGDDNHDDDDENHDYGDEDDDNDSHDDDDLVYVVYDAYEDDDAGDVDDDEGACEQATAEIPINQNALDEHNNDSGNPIDLGKNEIKQTSVSETENFPHLQVMELPVPAVTSLRQVTSKAEHST